MEMFWFYQPWFHRAYDFTYNYDSKFDFYNIVLKNKVVFGFHIWLNC